MDRPVFETPTGVSVPAVSTEEMQAIDRIATEEYSMDIRQMMEHAGRALAGQTLELGEGPILVVAGAGGNGGGGLAAARHLSNRGVTLEVLLDRDPSSLSGATGHQYDIVDSMDVDVHVDPATVDPRHRVSVVVDALIGYGISGPVRDPARERIELMNEVPAPTLSLDVPSGVDATTGEVRGVAVNPAATVTLALPKTGLERFAASLTLADIGIPPSVYEVIDVAYSPPRDRGSWLTHLQLHAGN